MIREVDQFQLHFQFKRYLGNDPSTHILKKHLFNRE